ncbi:DUF721 domain-containing protein [Amorphus coralli]|uniref:DUF721 domain-containing protein n=1 Tax=Amorphus coralli TaxID=340680 RepID=UPI00037F241A|nr:DciA family protein [Amorphus coralli]
MARGSKPRDDTRAAPPRRRRRAVPLADLIGDALTPAARKRGFASAAILTHWDSIVDEETARTALPERLIWPRRQSDEDAAGGGATLVVATNGASALVLQHTAPVIVDRLNTFFGWRAVERIKIVQRPIPAPEAPKPPPPPLTAEEEAALAERLAAMEDTPLKAALERLGRAVMSARPDRGR